MPQLSSPLTAPDGLPVIGAADLGQWPGVALHFASVSALTSAMVKERAAPLLVNGQPVTVAGEPAGVRRIYDSTAQHARTVVFPSGATVTLAADANTVIATTGAPAGGTGAVGDVAFDQAAGLRYTKTGASTWAAGVSVGGSAATGSGSLRVVYTSATCTSDADLSIGSSTFGTDQRAALQAILDQAADGPLLVVWDGRYSIGVHPSMPGIGLRVRSNTHIMALPGCGAIMRNGAGAAIFANYNWTAGAVAANDSSDHDIIIEGGIWNGNRPGQADRQLGFGLHFVKVRDVLVTGGAQFVNLGVFGMRIANCRDVTIDTVTVDAGPSAPLNTDGVHFNGPAAHITVRNVMVRRAHDDACAFNADEGYNANGTTTPDMLSADATYGPITDVLVDGLTLVDCGLGGVRVLSGGSRADRITVRNVKGKTKMYAVTIGRFVPSQIIAAGAGNVGTLTIEDFAVTSEIATDGTPNLMLVDGKVDCLILRGVRRTKLESTAFPTLVLASGADIRQLIVDGCSSSPIDGGSYLTHQFDFRSGSTVRQALFTGNLFDAPSAVSGCPIVVQSGAVIEHLALLGNVGRNFTDFVANAGTIGTLSAPAGSNIMVGGVFTGAADDFDRGNAPTLGSTSSGGYAWAVASNAGTPRAGIESNAAYLGADAPTTGGTGVATIDTGTSAFDISVTLSTIGANPNYPGLVGAFVDMDNFLMVQADAAAGAPASYTLQSKVGGSYSALDTTSGVTPAAGDVLRMKRNAGSTSVEWWVNGVSQGTSDATGISTTATKVGIMAGSSSNGSTATHSTARLDNFAAAVV